MLAYAIFSEYIPLAKNRTRVVTLTNKSPLAQYGCNTISTSGPYTSGNVRRRTHLYGTARKEDWGGRKTSANKNAMTSNNCARNTAIQGSEVNAGQDKWTRYIDSGISCVEDWLRWSLDVPQTVISRGKSWNHWEDKKVLVSAFRVVASSAEPHCVTPRYDNNPREYSNCNESV